MLCLLENFEGWLHIEFKSKIAIFLASIMKESLFYKVDKKYEYIVVYIIWIMPIFWENTLFFPPKPGEPNWERFGENGV